MQVKVKTDWWAEVEEAIERHSLLNHTFYRAWQSGRLSPEDLRYYAAQYYHHVAAFPRYVSGVHSNTEDMTVRRMLVENLVEEEAGPVTHPELWLRFAEGLGLSRKDVCGSIPAAETRECVDTFMRLTKGSGPLQGLGALYAYESQIPAVSATKRKGLKEFYGISDERSHAFFTVHEQADVWHSRVEREAAQRLAVTPQEQDEVKASVEEACRAVEKLLDGVVDARQIVAAC